MDPAPRLLPVLLVGRWVWPHPYQNGGEWWSLLAGALPHPDLECSPGPGHPLVPIVSPGGAAAAPIPHLTALIAPAGRGLATVTARPGAWKAPLRFHSPRSFPGPTQGLAHSGCRINTCEAIEDGHQGPPQCTLSPPRLLSLLSCLVVAGCLEPALRLMSMRPISPACL